MLNCDYMGSLLCYPLECFHRNGVSIYLRRPSPYALGSHKPQAWCCLLGHAERIRAGRRSLCAFNCMERCSIGLLDFGPD